MPRHGSVDIEMQHLKQSLLRSYDKRKALIRAPKDVAEGCWQQFRNFAFRGSVIDLAVGTIFGAAFSTVVMSTVEDIMAPFIGLALNGVELSNSYVILRRGNSSGPYSTLADARASGAVILAYGNWFMSWIKFFTLALILFLLLKFLLMPLRLGSLRMYRMCPFCLEEVPQEALKCKHCGSDLEPEEPTSPTLSFHPLDLIKKAASNHIPLPEKDDSKE
eukprot:NODE_6033_length_935_cov_37.421182_g5445_i0.p1 GENE.NODE_6033_length_935_cov_37.421182_g5445_i0~~NODE_6033_length_935_cov_37.421182_g5445_i0.p1  ORF type:complete len:219 (-),score=23.80 NODE_6033_length_935_cov_37.421182_g5445_i0:222-878(-)